MGKAAAHQYLSYFCSEEDTARDLRSGAEKYAFKPEKDNIYRCESRDQHSDTL